MAVVFQIVFSSPPFFVYLSRTPYLFLLRPRKKRSSSGPREKGLTAASSATTGGYGFRKGEGGADSVNKFKGPAKRHATSEWFESQYADPSRIQEVEVENLFRVIWPKTEVRVERITYKMGLKPETRRALVYNKHGAWVDTKPLNISIGDSAASCKDRQTRKEISEIQDYLHAKDISLLKRKYRQILHTNKVTLVKKKRKRYLLNNKYLFPSPSVIKNK